MSSVDPLPYNFPVETGYKLTNEEKNYYEISSLAYRRTLFFDNFFNPAYIKTSISDSSQVAVLHPASHTLASGIGTGLQ